MSILSLKQTVNRSITVRVFLSSLLAVCGIALLGNWVCTFELTAHDQQFAWICACACVISCTFLSLHDTRVISRIEAELIRSFNDRRRWQAARPIVGRGELVEAWNDLLMQADKRSAGAEPGRDDDSALIIRGYRSLPFGVAITDSQGQILRHNPAFKSFAKADSILGENIRTALPKLLSEETAARLSSGIRFVSVQVHQGTQSVDGVWRINRTRLDGRPEDSPGSIWMIEDITQATLAAESRDQFLTTATHELRTPLANIKAYAEVLVSEESIDVDQQREFCNTIHNECSRVSRLIDQLLAVDQLEAGSLVLSRGEVDVARVIRESLEHVRASADAKHQTLTAEVPEQLPIVVGDKDKIQAMLVNLLGNAIKYTQPSGTIELTINTSTNNRLDIAVVDNGPGIHDEDAAKIFNKFFRSTNPDITAEVGNGLGLTFAREIARLHGGDITVDSRLGEGSRFTAQLPSKPTPTGA